MSASEPPPGRQDDDGGAPLARFVEVQAPGGPRWRVDAGFVRSAWRCLWGEGCQGIHDVPTPERGEGCCSVGVVLADEEEAMTVAALAACLDDGAFQFAADARRSGVLADGPAGRRATRVVDGACIFLNRPSFAGGGGCALHLAALAEGDDPLDWKPLTCGRLPLKIDEVEVPGGAGDGVEVAVLRPWRREDWGPGGATMAWWCTEAPEAFTGHEPVLDSLAEPLRRALGPEAYAELRAVLGADGPARATAPDPS